LRSRRNTAHASPAISGVGLTETSLALAGCALILIVAIILDRRPYRPGKPNCVPLMIIALAGILVLGRHLLALLL
jgi:hypothetical protein